MSLSHPFFQSCFFPLLLPSEGCCGRNAYRVWAACLQPLVLPREQPDQAPVQLDDAGSRTLSPLETLEARVDRYIKCQ